MKKLVAVKRLVAVFLVLCMFPVIAGAESKGVNLVEFARRYYYAMDLAEVETLPAIMFEKDDGSTNVFIDGVFQVYYDDKLNVQSITMTYMGGDDGYELLRLVGAVMALCTPAEKISLSDFEGMADEIVLSITDDTVRFGDYAATMWYPMGDDGFIVKFELD